MSDKFSNIFNSWKKHSLTEGERARMRNELLMYMSEHPAKAPFSVRALDGLLALADSFGSQQMQSMRYIPATLAMVFVVGLGTAYAAEGALPGDALYTMKLHVNESVKGALALSDAAQASWHTEKLERRLSEAETLVATGRLTPVAQAQLEEEIHSTVEAFDKNVLKLASEEGEAAVAAVQSDLEASLIGHAEVLFALSSTSDAEIATQPIIRSVLTKAEAAQASRTSNEATVVAKRDGKNIRQAALEKKQKARQALSGVKAKASGKAEATTTAEVAFETTQVAESAMSKAEEKLKEGDYGSAFSNFQEAIRAVKTVEVHIDASERLQTNVQIFTRNRGESAGASLMMEAEPQEREDD